MDVARFRLTAATVRSKAKIALLVMLGAAAATSAHAQITVGGTGSDTIDSTAYTGNQPLTKVGTNTVTLTGTSTYSGLTTSSAGTLAFTTIDINAPSSLGTGADASPNGRIVIGGGNLTFTGSVSQTVNRNVAWDAGATGALEASGAAGAALVIADTSGNPFFNPGVRTFTFGGTNTDANTYAGIISNQASNASSVTKGGAGLWVLSGSNSYGGVTNINAGTLVVANNTALGTGGFSANTMTYIQDGATLALQGGISVDEHFNAWGSGVGGQGAIRNLSGNNALTVTNAGGAGYALRSNVMVGVDTGSLSISGFYEEGGSFGLTKVGPGTLTLTNANTYTGATTVTAGTLQLNNPSVTVYTYTGGELAIGNGAALLVTGTFQYWFPDKTFAFGSSGGGTLESGLNLVVDGSGLTIRSAGGGQNVVQGAGGFNLNDKVITFDVARGTDAATDVLVTAPLWNGGSVVKTGSGTLTFAGANTYTGTTTISAGTLQVGDGGTTGSLGSGAITNNAALVVNRSDTLLFPQMISGTGSFTQAGAGTTQLTGSTGYTGTTTIEQGTLALSGSGVIADVSRLVMSAGATLDVGTVQQGFEGVSGTGGTIVLRNGTQLALNASTPSSTYTFGGTITGTGDLIKQGIGTQILTGTSLFTGTTFITGGTLVATTSSLQGPVTNFSALEVSQGSTGSFAGAISGTGSVTKSGVGNAIFSGTSTYTGPTVVSGGRLSVNGALGNTAVTVQSNAELGGSGSIVGALAVLAGGTLAPGNSIASLAGGATSFAAGSTFGYEVDSSLLGSLGTAADLLVVSGNLDIAAGSILSFTDLASTVQPFVPTSTVFALINYSGAWNGGLFTYGGTPLADGSTFTAGSQQWIIDYNSSTGGLNYTSDYLPSSSFVTVTAVPEPSTIVLVGIGLAGMLLARRRK